MRRGGSVLLAVVAAWVVAAMAQTAPATPIADPAPTVILISFDGFRWDYLSKAPTPNIRSLIARGVQADALIPVFPSKTFPNHYSIVTGLYAGHHGIVANNILDPATGRRFAPVRAAEQRDPMWWGGEPIWVTAQEHGQVAAAMFWPGSEASIKGTPLRYWKPYDSAFPAADRVDAGLAWLEKPRPERPSLITLYFEDADTAGHATGPDSQDTRDAIGRLDGYLGRLLRGLERRNLLNQVNIVLVSDHGMAAVDNRRVVVVDDYVPLDDIDIVDINPTLSVVPKPGKEDAVYGALTHAPHLSAYRRTETPASWHYRDHPRIPPIVAVADEGWQVLRRSTVDQIAARKIRGEGGAHGYDPKFRSMHGIFIAAGPAFKRGARVPAFENIHLYDALAQVLGVPPAPNDGDPAVARTLLR
jgi:predicted AlkP superfamily pyrophosphatase or phosphodiesterase